MNAKEYEAVIKALIEKLEVTEYRLNVCNEHNIELREEIKRLKEKENENA